MKKRFISGLIFVCLVLGVFAGCGNVESVNAETANTIENTTTAAITTTRATTTVATTTKAPEPEIKLPLVIENNTVSQNFYIDKNNTARLYNSTEILQNVRSVHEANLTFTYKGEDKGEIQAGAAFFIKTDNTLWAYGKNDRGQLGDDTGVDKLTPDKIVKVMEDVSNIYLFDGIAYAIRNDKTLWAWGSDVYGKGWDTLVGSSTAYAPVEIKIPSGAISINDEYAVTSSDAIIYILSDFYKTGFEDIGKKGGYYYLADTKQVSDTPNFSFYAINIDNELVQYQLYFNPTQYIGTLLLSNVKQMTSHFDRTMGLRSFQRIYLLDDDNTLYAVGDNQNGELGDGSKISRDEPKKIAENVAAACEYSYVTLDGSLYMWNSEDPVPKITLIDGLISADNVADVFRFDEFGIGGFHTYVQTVDGKIISFRDVEESNQNYEVIANDAFLTTEINLTESPLSNNEDKTPFDGIAGVESTELETTTTDTRDYSAEAQVLLYNASAMYIKVVIQGKQLLEGDTFYGGKLDSSQTNNNLNRDDLTLENYCEILSAYASVDEVSDGYFVIKTKSNGDVESVYFGAEKSSKFYGSAPDGKNSEHDVALEDIGDIVWLN
jgi:hypothetical protein